MKDINLISQFHKQRQKDQIPGMGRQLGIAFLAFFAIGLLAYGTLAFLQARLTAKEAAIEQQIKAASPIVEVKKNIQDKQNKITQLSGIVDLVSAQSKLNTRIWDGISKAMPENVFMVNYAIDQSGNLNIMGKAKDMDSIAYFISKLKASGLFSDVYLSNVSSGSVTKNLNSGPTEYNFAAQLTLEK